MTAALLEPPPAVTSSAGEFPPGSPEWLAVRRTGIGGSDAAAAMGLSPWMTPFELWLDKRGELPPKPDSEPMQWGRLLEPLVREVYAQRTGRDVMVPKMTFRSEAHPFMLANLDGLSCLLDGSDSRLYEGKTARSAEGWGETGSGDIPEVYAIQVQHCMRVTRTAVTDVAVLIGGNDFRIFEVEADRELQEMIVEAEADFWALVKSGNPPPPEGVEDARRRWGSVATTGALLATQRAAEAVETLRNATEHRKNLEAVEAENKAFLMAYLAERDTLVDVDGRALVTWKLAKAPERFDLDLFKHDRPDLYRTYSLPGVPSRRFLLK